ncbi:MAG TPA: hypothetical protein VFE62_09200, partial [Gemmataceae bacterium]|nr:hypothetical protein [Gemmataceae bacterium]
NVISKSQPTTVNLLGTSDPTMLVSPPKSLDAFPLAWPKGADWSGPRPFVAVSPFPEFTRKPGDKPQELPAGRVGVSGKLVKPYEEDRYKIPVTPGKKVKLEVFAERIGSPIDVAVIVRNEKGDQLARGEDSPGTLDPVLEYAVPDKVTSIIVGVADVQGRAGPGGVYRLVVDPLTQAGTYRLTTPIQRLSLPVGRRVVVPVQIERQGYAGKIDLTLNLPPGVKAENTSIPDGADGTLMTLERSATPFEPTIATWRGRGVDGIEQAVVVKGHPLKLVQPWLAREIAVATSDAKPVDFAIDWRNLPSDTAIVPGIKLPLPILVKRAMDKTTVKLTLLTSQVAPLVNNQPDPNKTLRQEKPIEMPVKGNDSELVVLVPPELPAPVYDVTVQAELLDPAKKVLATSFTPVRRMAVRMPIVVKLNGPTRIEAPFDAKKGAVIKLQGKIERIHGIKADVALAVTGLPAGAKAEAVTVKADASDFAVNVTFPPNIPAGEFKNVKLSGSFAPDAKTPNIRVRSREVEVSLVLQSPPKK